MKKSDKLRQTKLRKAWGNQPHELEPDMIGDSY